MSEVAKFNFAHAILQFCQSNPGGKAGNEERRRRNFYENLLHVLQYSLLTVIQKFHDMIKRKNVLYHIIDLIH